MTFFFGSKESHDSNNIPQLSSSVSKVAPYSPYSFSACLVFKDQIRILPEWLAYHYTVMPLRRLIVMIDPLSIVSPEPIFKNFRELGMDITVWDDIDFNEGATKWWEKAATPEDSGLHKIHAFIYRQTAFYTRCLWELKDNKPFGDKFENKHKWVFLSDVDEFIVFNNYFEKDDVAHRRKRNNLRSQLPKIGEMTVAQYISSQNQSKSVWEAHACTVLPRILFGSLEGDIENVTLQVPVGFNYSSFTTMRSRHHQDPSNITVPGKTIIDVSRYNGQHARNPHQIIHDCVPNAFPFISESVLRIHHYIGQLESFINKPESSFHERNSMVNASLSDDSIRGWLKAFVDIVGKQKALELTEGLREWAIDHYDRVSKEVELGNFTYPFYKPVSQVNI